MSASSIQKKLNAANKKVAKIVGESFTVYRPISLMTPIKLSNFHSEQFASFALSDKFDKGASFGFDVYEVYTDTTDITSGDIFVLLGDTYVIMQARDLQPVQAFLANRTVSISRAGYSTTGGTFGKTEVSVMENVPASVQYAVASDVGVLPAASTNKSNIPAWDISVVAPDGSIQLNDIVLDSQGNRSMVLGASWSPSGYKLKTQELKKA